MTSTLHLHLLTGPGLADVAEQPLVVPLLSDLRARRQIDPTCGSRDARDTRSDAAGATEVADAGREALDESGTEPTATVELLDVARERGGLYDADDPGPRAPEEPTTDRGGPVVDGGEVGPSLRDAIRHAAHAVDRVVELAADESRPGSGELGGLLDLLGVIDGAHAAAVELTGQVEAGHLSERRAGLPLEQLLAFQSKATFGDRRMLASAAEILGTLPNVRRTFLAGHLGWAQVRAVVVEARPLNLQQRAELDEPFADVGWLARLEPDRVVDRVRERAARIRPVEQTKRTARNIERRFLHLQPQLDGAGGTGYFELDEEAFATVTAGLEAAMPNPSAGPNDTTSDAAGEADEADLQDPDGPDATTPDGLPGFTDRVAFRSRARQRADALLALAETFLGGHRKDGTLRRARPRVQVVADIDDLTGHDDASSSARLLLDAVGVKPHITAEAARRLAEDATLQVVFKQGGEIVGVSDPTESIPAKVRRAVITRDQGCRFPGCRMPVKFTDAHHVVPREHGGPTIVSNLVCLCRRHHVAVHEGGWRLTLHQTGAVTVRRGRYVHTSDPP